MSFQADYVKLAYELGIKGRIAGNQMYSRCPLHKDNSPSFSLNLRTGAWTCHFGCGPENGRDFPKLAQLVLNLTAREAEQWVISNWKKPDAEMLYTRIIEMLSKATPSANPVERVNDEPYFTSLPKNVLPVQFLQRGFTWETVRKFDMRWDAAREAVVIPVYDHLGEFKGVVARLMRPRPGQGKYDNTIGLPKSHILFGLGPQHVGGAIILVEGPLDAIWLQQCGYSAVAMFGTTLSEEHIRLLQLWRVYEIVVLTDNPLLDKAGAKAQKTIGGQLRKSGWLSSQITTAAYPVDKKDANDCTPQELNQMLAARRPLSLTGA